MQDELMYWNVGCINESVLEDILQQSQEDIQTEIDQLNDELKQTLLQHRQQEEKHFQQINLLTENPHS